VNECANGIFIRTPGQAAPYHDGARAQELPARARHSQPPGGAVEFLITGRRSSGGWRRVQGSY
jgi:hypothetical protein